MPGSNKLSAGPVVGHSSQGSKKNVLRSRQGSKAKERICRRQLRMCVRGWNGRPSTGKRSIAQRFNTTRLRFHRTRLARDQECDKRAHRHQLSSRRHSLIRLGTDCPSSGSQSFCSRPEILLLQFRGPVQHHRDGLGRYCRRVNKEPLAIGSDVPTENL